MTVSARSWAGASPNHFSYELFLDDQGQKISKSKGNGLTIDEWLTYAATESLSYFMYQKPKTAKRMHFDVIPQVRWMNITSSCAPMPAKTLTPQVNNPVWHIHQRQSARLENGGAVLDAAESGIACRRPRMRRAFGALSNAMRRMPHPKAIPIWTPPQALRCAISPTGSPRLASSGCPMISNAPRWSICARRLAAWDGGLNDEALQSMVFAVGKDHGFEPLRDWFKALYEVLLGASDGPRFGGFIALYGIKESLDLIDRGLAGELAA
ncbi:MAG: hypothetical protein V9G14_19115 [Cypionkella sp.]